MPEKSRTSKSLPALAVEFKDLVVAYAKQETIEPIKGLGRFVAFGLAGSILLANGVVLIVLALLRLLQTEWPTTFDGNWSFAPYAIAVVFCVIVLWRSARAVTAAKRRKEARA